MLAPFIIHEPRTVGEASQMLVDMGGEAAVYAGGTELLMLMKEGLVHYPHLVNIKTIPGLDGVGVHDHHGIKTLTLGALVTHRQIAMSPIVRESAPLLAEMAAQVANTRVRATGTIGGNLCFGEPHSDPATLLLAWDATVDLSSVDGTRTVPITEFFLGLLETARRSHEVLTAVHLALLPPTTGGAYEKFSLHERPSVTVAALLDVHDGAIRRPRISVGSAGPVPIRATAAEERLTDVPPTTASFEAAAAIVAAAVDPVDDLYGSAAYKRHLVGVLTARALARAAGVASEVTH